MHCETWKIGGRPCHVLMGDSYKIRAGDKEFYFDFHDFLGPMMLGKRGNPVQTFPPQKSPFWDALHFWLKQGRQIDGDGWCVFKWEMQLVQIVKHIAGRHYLVLSGRHRESE